MWKCSVFVCLFCRFKTKQKAKKGFEKAKAYKWVLRLIGYLSLFLRWKCWGPLSLSSWAMKTHPLTLLTTWSITSMKTVKISTLFFYFFPSVYVRPLGPVWLLRKKLVLLSKALLPVMGFAKFLFFWFPQQSRGTISVKYYSVWVHCISNLQITDSNLTWVTWKIPQLLLDWCLDAEKLERNSG